MRIHTTNSQCFIIFPQANFSTNCTIPQYIWIMDFFEVYLKEKNAPRCPEYKQGLTLHGGQEAINIHTYSEVRGWVYMAGV